MERLDWNFVTNPVVIKHYPNYGRMSNVLLVTPMTYIYCLDKLPEAGLQSLLGITNKVSEIKSF